MPNQPVPTAADSLPEVAVACHECGLMQRLPAITADRVVGCARCGAHLERLSREGLVRLLPLTIAAALLFLLTNAEPIVSISVTGSSNEATIIDAITALAAQGMTPLALLVVLTTLVFPAFDLTVLASAALSLRRNVRSRTLAGALRLMHALRRWAMVEVFMLGALVSVVKLAAIADVIPGKGLWSLAAYVGVTAAAHASFDARDYWARMDAPA